MANKISRLLAVISVVMLLLAMPSIFSSSYVIAVRIVVFTTAIFLILKARKLKKNGWARTMMALAILFNPFFPVRLDKVDLVLLEVITVCLFVTSLVKVKSEEEPPKLNVKLVKIVIGVLFFVIIVSVSLYCYFLKQRYLP